MHHLAAQRRAHGVDVPRVRPEHVRSHLTPAPGPTLAAEVLASLGAGCAVVEVRDADPQSRRQRLEDALVAGEDAAREAVSAAVDIVHHVPQLVVPVPHEVEHRREELGRGGRVVKPRRS